MQSNEEKKIDSPVNVTGNQRGAKYLEKLLVDGAEMSFIINLRFCSSCFSVENAFALDICCACFRYMVKPFSRHEKPVFLVSSAAALKSLVRTQTFATVLKNASIFLVHIFNFTLIYVPCARSSQLNY